MNETSGLESSSVDAGCFPPGNAYGTLTVQGPGARYRGRYAANRVHRLAAPGAQGGSLAGRRRRVGAHAALQRARARRFALVERRHALGRRFFLWRTTRVVAPTQVLG